MGWKTGFDVDAGMGLASTSLLISYDSQVRSGLAISRIINREKLFQNGWLCIRCDIFPARVHRWPRSPHRLPAQSRRDIVWGPIQYSQETVGRCSQVGWLVHRTTRIQGKQQMNGTSTIVLHGLSRSFRNRSTSSSNFQARSLQSISMSGLVSLEMAFLLSLM
jgi:hypothetical protein